MLIPDDLMRSMNGMDTDGLSRYADCKGPLDHPRSAVVYWHAVRMA